ncbi:hypothetical protein SDC9_106329 [bioreactor metagenome]|uniref:Type 4 fimbrial biogenesis protein PilX N-terminal domain-containing protein n=1 Tax=bioreactor metagenome TaxID=1076179 RepID=A0A645B219_9ZZZZ|nr:hypothetical protein [Erysipelotrichaceae bacterium]
MTANKRTVSFGVGISSLLMVMVVLCMTILTALAYLQVHNYQQQYDQQAAMLSAYYAADAAAINNYAKISEILYDNHIMYSSEDYLTECRNDLILSGYQVDNDLVSYSIVIDANHQLNVVLVMQPYQLAERLAVRIWEMEVTTEGNYNGTEFDT